jgi:serine/threonine-protein kinase
VDATCTRAQEALIAGELTSGLALHVDGCARCERVRRLSALLAARSRGVAATSVSGAFVRGQELLRYRLDELLGEGGQGVVFRATELDVPESVVALKIVPRGRDDLAVQEVSHAKRINHPNVCRVNHTEVHGGFRLIEMEYVDGGTLAERLAPSGAGPLAPAAAAAIFRGVLDGLEVVHRKGILHLDLKPLNILLREGKHPVVTDFGLSARAGGAGAGGTRGWTAPEVDRGAPADARADVYSLGALLAALFSAPSPSLASVIARATAPLADDRYPDVAALRDAFEETLRAPGDASRSRRRRTRVVAGAALAALALVGAVLLLRPAPPADEVVDFQPVDTTAPAGHSVDATPYLRAHGIAIADVRPPGARLVVRGNLGIYENTALDLPPRRNVLMQVDTGGAPASYTLVLARPARRLVVARPPLVAPSRNGTTHPAWSAHAVDARGREVGRCGEELVRSFRDVPPVRCTLEAPDREPIARVRIDSDPTLDGRPFAAFDAVVIERLTLSRGR